MHARVRTHITFAHTQEAAQADLQAPRTRGPLAVLMRTLGIQSQVCTCLATYCQALQEMKDCVVP